jgi:hypothetical protein
MTHAIFSPTNVNALNPLGFPREQKRPLVTERSFVGTG